MSNSNLKRQCSREISVGAVILYVRHRLPRSSVTDAATDVINLPFNEDCCYSKPLSVLACGVGDPRNVLLSLCNLSETYEEELTFVLNDICACTLARTVLILYILFKGKCCPSRYLCQ